MWKSVYAVLWYLTEGISLHISHMEVQHEQTYDRFLQWLGIKVNKEHNMCSNFSFDITDPQGKSQHVTMGGDDPQRALELAKEMIDMEMSLSAEE